MTCNKTTYQLVESYLTALDCPRSLAVLILFRENEHQQLVDLEVNPDSYLDSKQFRDAYLATEFLSKADFLDLSIDRRKIAIDKFFVAEQACAIQNQKSFIKMQVNDASFDYIHNVCIRKIENILGFFTADEFFDSANWGPGVSITKSVKRDPSSTNKFRCEGGITRYLFDFISGIHATAYPLWKPIYCFQEASEIITVPKNSKTDRTIAIEPGINLWYQKAIGLMIRRRLLRYGLDLNSQQVNQDLARKGSISNRLCTVDFSAASDTISIKTVRELLPVRWFILMDLVRSQCGSVKGSDIVHRFSKFSSMGNGFTFELETLIFFCIALSVCQHLKLPVEDVSVYGDDVIIPSEAFNLYREICMNYGFSVNLKKSYSSGCFRESCGSHYFLGTDCKPYYLRRVIKSEGDIYLAHNSIVRLSHYKGFFPYCDIRFLKCSRFLYHLVKRPCKISEGYGDSGFIVNFDVATPSRARNGIEGYRTLALLPTPLKRFAEDHALLLARLKDRSVERNLGNTVTLKGRVRYSRKRIFIRRWYNLGPWF